jgi:hypothetical protein
MYVSSLIRIALYLTLGIAAIYTYPQIDGWVPKGIRDIVPGNYHPYVVLAIGVAMACADLVGTLLPALRPRVERPWLWGLLLAVACGVVFWTFRVPQWLGDLSGIDRALQPQQLGIESASPFGGMSSTYTINAAFALGIRRSAAIGALSVLFGATAVAALFGWTRRLSPEWPLPLAMLLSSGFMVIFFGYVEKATPKSTAMVCWYIYWATRALRERRYSMTALSSACVSATILMHGSGLCWLPAHAWYVWRRGGWRQTAVGLAAFLVPVILFAILIDVERPIWWSSWGNINSSRQWIKAYCVTNCGYDFWSLLHLADIFHCLFILSPLAVLCLPEAFLRCAGEVERWLALGALGWLFLSATWFPVFGYLSDWDLFVATPVVVSCFTIAVGIRVMPPAGFRRLGLAWIVGGLMHAFSWWRLFSLPL